MRRIDRIGHTVCRDIKSYKGANIKKISKGDGELKLRLQGLDIQRCFLVSLIFLTSSSCIAANTN
jgi:hypothetical protein